MVAFTPPGLVAVDDTVAGVIAISDPGKASTGVEVVMLTGHNRTIAEAVAHQLGIERVGAEVLPGHKADVVTRLKAEGRGGRHDR